jgi:ATP-dependent exoDNAse (exonuclease V) alpha subunit
VERFICRYDSQDPDSASFAQFPLRLAWAMTIHKSQGLTLDSAYLDIRAAREPVKAYVAVSRVLTLEGLQWTSSKACMYRRRRLRFTSENEARNAENAQMATKEGASRWIA